MLALFSSVSLSICCWPWQEVGWWVRFGLHSPAVLLGLRMSGCLLSAHAASVDFELDRSLSLCSDTMFAGSESWEGHQR